MRHKFLGGPLFVWKSKCFSLSKHIIHCAINEVQENSNMVTLNSTWICYLWVYEADSTLLLYIKQKCGVKNCIPNFFQCSQLNSKDTINFKSVQHTAPLTISKQQFLFLILWKSATKIRYFIKERNESDKTQKQHN